MYKRIFLLSTLVSGAIYAADFNQSMQGDLKTMLSSFPQLQATYYGYQQSKEHTNLTKTYGYPSWYLTYTPYNYYYYREHDPASPTPASMNNLRSKLGLSTSSTSSDSIIEYNYHYSELDYGASQVLFDFGAQRASNKMAELGTKNVFNRYQSQKDQTIIQGMHAYIQIIEARNILLLCSRLLDSIKQNIQEADNAAPLTQTDIKKAQATISQIQGIIAQYKGQLASGIASYKYYFGHEPKTPINELHMLKIPKNKLPKSEKEAVNSVLSQNLNIKSAQNNISSAKESYKQAWATQFPSLNVRFDGTYSDNANDASEKIDDYTISLSANYNANFLSPYYRVKGAKYGILSAQESLKNTRTSMTQSAQSVWGGLSNYTDKVNAELQQMNAAINFIKAATEEFKDGDRSLLDLLDAKMQVLNAGIEANNTYNQLVLQAYTMLSLTNKLSTEDARVASNNELEKKLNKIFAKSVDSDKMFQKLVTQRKKKA